VFVRRAGQHDDVRLASALVGGRGVATRSTLAIRKASA
jgi:hypothetical protein